MSRVQRAVISIFNDKKNSANLFNITKNGKKVPPTDRSRHPFSKKLIFSSDIPRGKEAPR